MKNIVKILLTAGVACAIALPSFAEFADVTFNRVRIAVDGVTKTSWDENTKTTDLPSSITYKDTTYVPLRWISENMNKDVAWNGDSKTVSVTANKNGEKFIAEKPDLNGNIWIYAIKTENNGDNVYLTVTDKKRNFERVYPIQGENAYKTDDESIWFVHGNGWLYRLYYANDENTQDGVEISRISTPFSESRALIHGEFVYATVRIVTNGTGGYLVAYNINTGESDLYYAITWSHFSNLKIIEENSDNIVFSFKRINNNPYITDCKIIFNKKSIKFENYEETGSKPDGQIGKLFRDFDEIDMTGKFSDVIDDVRKLFEQTEYFVENDCKYYAFHLVSGENVLFSESTATSSFHIYLELKDGTRIPLQPKEGGGFVVAE